MLLPQVTSPLRVQPSVPADRESRQRARNSFRLPDASKDLTTSTPQLPHLSWIHQRYLLFGINHSAVPPDLDLSTPRAGRAIKYVVRQATGHGNSSPVSLNVAMFAADHSISFIPPYPGLAHDDANTPNTAASCYVDGTQGAFDFRRVPQLYNSRAPWRGFHDNPLVLDWDPDVCEYFSSVDFFIWNEPGNAGAGGHWIRRRLAALFSKRGTAENEFARLMRVAQKKGVLPFPTQPLTFSFDMPFYDPLEWDDVTRWSTWNEGRDPLANSLQYVAELIALNRWLRVTTESSSPSSGEYPPANAALMGVWAPTITKQSEWEFLRRNGVPVYIATLIPDWHPLASKAITGSVDNDERYRVNAFDAAHSLKSYWLLRHPKTYPTLGDLALETRAEYLPLSLERVAPMSRPPSSGVTSCLYTWHFPIYQETDVERFEQGMLQEQMAQIDIRREIDDIFPVTSTRYAILQPDVDRHPLLDVIGTGGPRDNAMSRYEECYDDELDCYYPVRLGKGTSFAKARMEACSYRFSYPDLRVEIFSEYPFPGRRASYGLRDDADENDILINMEPRQYYNTNQMTRKPRQLAFTWTPDFLPAVQTNISRAKSLYDSLKSTYDGPLLRHPVTPWLNVAHRLQIYVFDDPVYDVIYAQGVVAGINATYVLTEEYKDWGAATDYSEELELIKSRQTSNTRRVERACRYIFHHGVSHGRLSPMAEEDLEAKAQRMEEDVKQLAVQRSVLSARVSTRLFKAARGNEAISPIAFPWHIPRGSSDCICYPVRFSRLDGDVSPSHLLAMLGHVLDIAQHDVVVYASYKEIDYTRTIDLGFRYCEDALYCRAILHGVEVDDRLLEVTFLRYMSRDIHAIPFPLELSKAPTRSPHQRLQTIVSLVALPGLDDYLITDAYKLEQELTRWIKEAGLLSLEEIQEIKDQERTPMYHGT